MSSPVHVVIVNFNRWRDTIECLESVLRSRHVPLHVIVVDNGSRDDSLARFRGWADGIETYTPDPSTPMARFSDPPVPKPVSYGVLDARSGLPPSFRGNLPQVTFIASSTNHGFAGGNNLALGWLLDGGATGYACLLNNDMVVAPDAIAALVAGLERDATLGAIGGVVLDYASPDVAQIVGGGWVSRLGSARLHGAGAGRHHLSLPSGIDYVTGGWLLTEIETIRAVGLLDDRFFLYSEDADWGHRMRAAGFRLGCKLDALVWHKGTQTIGAGSPFQDYHVVKSTLQYVRKHAPAFLALAFAHSLFRSLLPKIVRAQWKRARSVARAHLDTLRHV